MRLVSVFAWTEIYFVLTPLRIPAKSPLLRRKSTTLDWMEILAVSLMVQAWPWRQWMPLSSMVRERKRKSPKFVCFFSTTYVQVASRQTFLILVEVWPFSFSSFFSSFFVDNRFPSKVHLRNKLQKRCEFLRMIQV